MAYLHSITTYVYGCLLDMQPLNITKLAENGRKATLTLPLSSKESHKP